MTRLCQFLPDMLNLPSYFTLCLKLVYLMFYILETYVYILATYHVLLMLLMYYAYVYVLILTLSCVMNYVNLRFMISYDLCVSKELVTLCCLCIPYL